MYSARATSTFLDVGFPIRRSTGRCLYTAHRRLSQFYHVLHRLLVPRHPPNALTSLTTTNFCTPLPSLAFPQRLVPKRSGSGASPRLLFAWPRARVSARDSFPRIDPRRSAACFHATSLSILMRTSTSFFLYVLALRSSIRFSIADPGGPVVGQARFELATPRLSSVCSNQLSYWPIGDRSLKTE